MSVEFMVLAGTLAMLMTAKFGLLMAKSRLANSCAKPRSMV